MNDSKCEAGFFEPSLIDLKSRLESKARQLSLILNDEQAYSELDAKERNKSRRRSAHEASS